MLGPGLRILLGFPGGPRAGCSGRRPGDVMNGVFPGHATLCARGQDARCPCPSLLSNRVVRPHTVSSTIGNARLNTPA